MQKEGVSDVKRYAIPRSGSSACVARITATACFRGQPQSTRQTLDCSRGSGWARSDVGARAHRFGERA